MERGDRVGGVAEPDGLLDARVVGRLGVVAVVDVQRDVAALGQEAALAGHPLAADVVGRVDVAVRQHHRRPSSTTWGPRPVGTLSTPLIRSGSVPRPSVVEAKVTSYDV